MQQQLNDITLRFFRYFDQRFHGLDSRFKQQDEHIDGLYKLVDHYAKQAEQMGQGVVIDEARVARLEAMVSTLNSQRPAQ